MIRKAMILGMTLVLAGCAARTPGSSAPSGTVPIPVPPPQRPEPPAFSGLSSDTLKARLGTPAFTRKDGATEMWRYDTKACHAFFFLTGGKVAHVETIPRPADQAADPSCLNALRKIS